MSEWIGVRDDYLEYQGFVYKITNLKTGEYYIGKKNFSRIKKLKPLKGRKNKRHFKVESDWRDYYGSSLKLQEDIEKLGTESFRREITHYCRTKTEMSYTELLEQIKHDVLNDEKSYNGIIHVRLNRTK